MTKQTLRAVLFGRIKPWHLFTVVAVYIVAAAVYWCENHSEKAALWAMVSTQSLALVVAFAAFFKHYEKHD